MQDFSTIIEEGRPYSFDATAESGGRLHWQGVVSVPGAYSEGTLTLENISLHPIWRFARDWLAFELKDGELNVAGDYRVEWGSELLYTISNGSLSISDIDVRPQDVESIPETAITLRTIELSEFKVDGPGQSVEIANVALSGVEVQGFSEGSEVSLAALFEMSLPESNEREDTAAETSESSWTIYLPSVRVNDSRVRWRSEYTSPPLLEVSPIELEMTELRWPPTDDSGLSLALTVNDVTTISLDGKLSLKNGAGSFKYLVDKIQLALANPNIPAALNAEITAGEVTVEGEFTLAEFAPTRVSMEGSSSGFSGTIEGEEDAIIGWESIRWRGLDVNLVERSVEMKTLSLNGYSGRLHIYEDGSINTQRILQAEVDNALEEGTLEEDALQAWSFNIPTITFTDSQLYFRDESLPISFGTVIGELNGTVTGLSSNSNAETTVDLKGSVDGYAPVILAGTLSPFAEASALDMGLSFDGVDLVRLTPYSGTYAGYAVDRGILNLDLHYSLDGNHLKGDNSIVIEQLKLGEKIDSDKAADLPLELALALLTDMNGMIDMDVPVSGDVDDPDFSLGSVVSSAFVDIITKAVTAPFALLANLVGSEEDMQRITFSSGSSELDDASKAKLGQLIEAMAQRPGLNLVLLGRLHPSADRERLKKNVLEQALLTEGLSAEEVANKGELWADAIRTRFNQLPQSSGTGGEDTEVSVHKQYQYVIASIAVSTEQLQKLAEERSVSVKRYLVNELHFPAERSAIELVDVDDEKNVFSGVELGVGI